MENWRNWSIEMIDFEKAIQVVKENIEKFLPKVTELQLESIINSPDNKLFEITYSYFDKKNKDDVDATESNIPNVAAMARIMRMRRHYKVFFVDAVSGEFRGFKNSNEYQ